MAIKPILCVDFDGVIHHYLSPGQGVDQIPDGPVPGVMKWLYGAMEDWEIHIYSARSRESLGRRAMEIWFDKWAKLELGREKGDVLFRYIIFAHQKPAAKLTIDDRAICFDGDWSKLNSKTLLNFKPWNRRK